MLIAIPFILLQQRTQLVTMQLGGPQALSDPEVEELLQIRQQRGWGRSPQGLSADLEIDPRAVELISQIVLQVLQAKGDPLKT